MTAFQWFITIREKMQPKYLHLSGFVLEDNYVECEGVVGAFLQQVGIAVDYK